MDGELVNPSLGLAVLGTVCTITISIEVSVSSLLSSYGMNTINDEINSTM